VSSAESPVHHNYKQAILDAKETGTYVLNKRSSPCIRALKTERTAKIYENGLMPADTFKGIMDVYFGGDMEASVGLAGQSSGLIDEVKTAKQIIDETVAGFFEATARLSALDAAKNF